MLKIFRSDTDTEYDELRSLIRKLEREIKLETPSERALQPQENNFPRLAGLLQQRFLYEYKITNFPNVN